LDELDAALALQSRSNTEPAAAQATVRAGDQPADAGRQGGPPGSKPIASETPATASARHKVVAGDTLSKIAAKYYGSKSRRVINAIFDANRSSLANPDTVGAGVELLLPTIEGVGAPSAVMPPVGRSPTARPAGRPPEPAEPHDQRFQWYQIQKNDRYVSIAREQLGDESRWRELYELNKDKFPDPGRIREGVRIKLPVTVAVASGKGRP
jgi:nucleoid-associated protein YgaU